MASIEIETLESAARHELDRLAEVKLLRKVQVDAKQDVLNFSSNDYLNLSSNPLMAQSFERATSETGIGAGSSRLVTGTLPVHEALERDLADYLHVPATLVFGAGYLANIGLCQAFISRDDLVFADRYIHASLIDGIQLSRARFRRFRHNDMNHLEGGLRKTASSRSAHQRVFIVTESLFSMDGDLSPLREIVSLAERYEADVIVDEAHALGVFGPRGGGRVLELGLSNKVSAVSGTLSKAFGAYGGVVATSSVLRELLVNRARSFIFNTALPPAIAACASTAVAYVSNTPMLGQTLLQRSKGFREQLRAQGITVGGTESQIIPIIVGSDAVALSISATLREKGILAVAIRPPTVPVGSARLRLSVTLGHSERDLTRAASIIGEALRTGGVL